MRSLLYTSGLDRQRMVKFFIVGASGFIVNLIAMAAIISAVGWEDWRASVLASLVATVNNYVFNNFWTFRDRIRTGLQLFTGYGRFVVASTGGLIVTTVVFAVLRKTGAVYLSQGQTSLLPDWSLVAFQGVAILFGALSNYHLNGLITWKAAPRMRLEPVTPAEHEASVEKAPVPVGAGPRHR